MVPIVIQGPGEPLGMTARRHVTDLAQRLELWLHVNPVAHGSPMPSERTLARVLETSRWAIRQAMIELAERGRIETSGPGRRITADPNSNEIHHAVLVVSGLPTIQLRDHSTLSIHETLFSGLSHAIESAGYSEIMVPPGPDLIPRLLALAYRRPVGIIIFPGTTIDPALVQILPSLRQHHIPVTFYGDLLREIPAGVTSVHGDHYRGSEQLVSWFHHRQARRLLYISPRPLDAHSSWWERQRFLGAQETCQRLGLETLQRIDLPQLTYTGDEPSFIRMQSLVLVGYLHASLTGADPIDGIMVVNDGLCFAVAAACQQLGRSPVIVGYDATWLKHLPLIAVHGVVQAATVDPNLQDLGRALLATLLDQKFLTTNKPVLVGPRLIDLTSQKK